MGGLFDRAMGCLLGGALGDAMGMPTQTLSPKEIAGQFGYLRDFARASADHPVSKGLLAGTITDDTEQTLLLAEVLAASPGLFDDRLWAQRLMEWESDLRARGSHDLLGPSSKRALMAIANGASPEEAGRHGDTNGAAMRIGPVGIAFPSSPLDFFVDRVHDACKATHNTSIAISGASAVGAAISSAIDGHPWALAKSAAIEAARHGRECGYWVAGADIAARIEWAIDLIQGQHRDEAIKSVIEFVGTSVATPESVPAAFAVAEMAAGDAWEAAIISANLGGDTDTIGAMAGSMCGSLAGAAALPQDKLKRLRGFDRAHAEQLAARLLTLRNTNARAVA